MRTKGAKNVVKFQERTAVESSASKQIRHLADISGNPLKEFTRLLDHQANYLDWIEDRHDKIVALQTELMQLKGVPKGKGPQGAKEMTFVKYRWYSEHLVLLEAINAFEVFYKKTFIRLGDELQEYVQPESDDLKDDKISAHLLWSVTDRISIPALVFEQKLFHDLNAIDAASQFLVGDRRYNQKSPSGAHKDRVRALRVIFQIRHTLSHNSGRVTTSDASKFRRLKFSVKPKEVVDASRDHFGVSIFRELRAEANDFTGWLATAAAEFLKKCVSDRGIAVPKQLRNRLVKLLGASPSWATVPWS